MTEHKNENWQGKRLREAAESAGLSASEIGRRMKKAPSLVSRWWSGDRNISLEDLKIYSTITSCPLDYFLYQERRLPENIQIRQTIGRLTAEATRLATEVEQLSKKLEEPGNVKYVQATSGNMVPVPADTNPDQAAIDKIDNLLHGDCIGERIA